MGVSKAHLDFAGEPMLARVAGIVSPEVSNTIVVAQKNQSLPLLPEDCEVIFDQIPGAGPLAGLAAGLENLRETCDASLVVSCDHPLVEPEFLRSLIGAIGDRQALIPAHDGRCYPLVAIYRVGLAVRAQTLLEQGERRIMTFVKAVAATKIDARKLLGNSDLRSLLNVNDRATYESALRIARS